LRAIRAIAPDLAFLIPGVGAQGGEADPVLIHGPATKGDAGSRPGGGLLGNVSRGIVGAATASGDDSPGDVGHRIAEAAADWARRLPVLP
jgi:orotidine-5'-phosphate decarboxylase